MTAPHVKTIVQFADDYAASLRDGTAGEFLGFSQQNLYNIEVIAHQLYTQGRHERALDLVRGLLLLDRARHYPHLLLGDLLLRQGDAAAAKAPLERAHTLKPDDITTTAKLGEALLKLGEHERAAQLLSSISEESQEEPSAVVLRARALLRTLSTTQA